MVENKRDNAYAGLIRVLDVPELEQILAQFIHHIIQVCVIFTSRPVAEWVDSGDTVPILGHDLTAARYIKYLLLMSFRFALIHSLSLSLLLRLLHLS